MGIFNDLDVALHSVHVLANDPPADGEERIEGWEAEAEALPPGAVPPPVPTVTLENGPPAETDCIPVWEGGRHADQARSVGRHADQARSVRVDVEASSRIV